MHRQGVGLAAPGSAPAEFGQAMGELAPWAASAEALGEEAAKHGLPRVLRRGAPAFDPNGSKGSELREARDISGPRSQPPGLCLSGRRRATLAQHLAETGDAKLAGNTLGRRSGAARASLGRRSSAAGALLGRCSPLERNSTAMGGAGLGVGSKAEGTQPSRRMTTRRQRGRRSS